MDASSGNARSLTWWAILALALVLRLAAGVWWQERLPADQSFFFPDSQSYWHLGRTIAHGEPYIYGEEEARIFRTPGYPLLLAPLFYLGGDHPSPYWGRALSAVLGTCSVAVVMQMTHHIFNARAAQLAGLYAACDPGTISQGVFILSEAPFCPLMLLHLYAWYLAEQAHEYRPALLHAAWGGAMGACATLMRPSWLLFLPLAAGVLFFVRPNRTQQVGIAGIMALTFGVTMAPWWWRNYQLTGRFIPTTLQVGASLYDGLHPEATGGSDMRFVATFLAEQCEQDAHMLSPSTNTFEERLDERMKQAALAWAGAHPGRVCQLAAIKLIRLWTPWPNARDIGGTWAKIAVAVGYVPLLLTGVAGAGRFVRRDRSLSLLVLPAVYFTLLHCVFVSSVRYRQPALLPLIILAAGWVMERIVPRTLNEKSYLATE